jgi:hypothetical protein
MSNLSRRSVVTGAAAMPVAALPIAATAMASDAQRLFEIEAEACELNEAIKVAGRALDDPGEFMQQWQRENPRPGVGEYECADAEYTEWLQRSHVEPVEEENAELLIHQATKKVGQGAMIQMLELVKEGAEEREILSFMLAAKQWNKRHEMALASCGLKYKEKEFEDLVDQSNTLFAQAAEIQATTLAGLKCKARLAAMSDT